jgi:8-oxo-dGTP diphosphatase
MITRESVRAVVVNGYWQILLSRVTPLGTANDERPLWVTLGGRPKVGEDLGYALKRELVEELGSLSYVVGSKIWYGDEVVNWGGDQIRLIEHFFLVRVPPGEYSFVGVDAAEVSGTHELKWWTPNEIAASGHRFVPRDLCGLLADLASRGNSSCRKIRLE